MADPSVPDWLTNDFFKTCLESDADNFPRVHVSKFTVEQAVPAGNNYGSNLLRVNVRYNTPNSTTGEEVSLIVKAPLQTGFIEQFKDLGNTIYSKEPKYYNEFIKETYKLSKHDVVPKHYLSPNPYCLVLEDLKASGYKMVDRTKLLDLDHSKLYIEASAKLHALSIAVNKKRPEIIEAIGKEAPGTDEGVMDRVYKTLTTKGVFCMEAYLEDRPDINRDYLEVVRNLAEDDRMWKLYHEAERQSRTKPLQALAMMDPWCTNMMFTYDDGGKVSTVKLLDFQTTRLTSPVFEFVSFLWSSVHPTVRRAELPNLYRMYCEALNDNLASLHCPERLTLEALQAEALELSPVVMMLVSAFMPLCTSEDAADIDDFMAVEVSKESIRESTLYKMYHVPLMDQLFPLVFKEFEETGVFSYLKEKLI